jgi:FkbM family methyltransferase
VPANLAANAVRRKRLRESLMGTRESPIDIAGRYDVVVTYNEVNNRHGTGVLVQRLFPDDSRVISIRSASHYGGDQAFGHMQLAMPAGNVDRASIYRWVLAMTDGLEIDRVTCVPFHATDLMLAIALRDALGVPFCLYVMDDQNVHGTGIPDPLMAEAIAKATVRLAISSDMRDAYELKYQSRFWIAPPTASPALVPASGGEHQRDTAVIVGNIWGRSWLAALRDTVRATGIKVDWFANSPNGGWLGVEPSDLQKDGITLCDPLPEAELARRLGDYELALHPGGPAGAHGENAGVASLSLPTRIPYLICASDLPIVVLGDRMACAARFVSYFGVGAGSEYKPESFTQVMAAIRSSGWREKQVEGLTRLRAILRTDAMPSWIRVATDRGRPPSLQFEELAVKPQCVVARYIDDAPSLGPWLSGFEPVAAALRRIALEGYRPDFVIDVGASTGVWSQVAASVFPDAHYVLVEPLLARYEAASQTIAGLKYRTVVEAAVGSSAGHATLYVDRHLYGASLLADSLDGRGETEAVTVPVTTLDVLAADAGLTGSGILKLDIQGGEPAALEGGRRLMAELVDVAILEVTCDPGKPTLPSFTEVNSAMECLGFVYYDDVGEWRDPAVGVLIQRDVMYVRRAGALAESRRAR